MTPRFPFTLYRCEPSTYTGAMLVIQRYFLQGSKWTWISKKKKRKNKSFYIKLRCHLWICISRFEGALEGDNWLDRKATWCEELAERAAECFPRLSWGLFKDTSPKNLERKHGSSQSALFIRCPESHTLNTIVLDDRVSPEEECVTDSVRLHSSLNTSDSRNLRALNFKRWKEIKYEFNK